MTSSASRIAVVTSTPRVDTPVAAVPDLPARPAGAPPSLWDAAHVLAQLERILGSDAFDASARNRAFLRYVVGETLAGRADHIKGYTVAQEVFQRDADFDPQLDPVVRIEASRLRRSLERYYLTAGRHDRLYIDLPKGGYVPKFDLRESEGDAAEADAPVVAAPRPRPFLIVRRFENLSDVPADKAIAPGLADELIGHLTLYDDVMVIAEASARPTAAGLANPANRLAVAGYVLQGSTRRCGRKLRVSAQLLDYADGRYLWVRSFDRLVRAGDPWALQEDVAAAIAKAVAGPNGALAALRAR